MSSIHIHRHHQLGLAEARKIAFLWAEKAKEKLGMECTYTEGEAQDTVHFHRPGIEGTLKVCDNQLVLEASLGFLFSAFKQRIETEINEQFDSLLHTP